MLSDDEKEIIQAIYNGDQKGFSKLFYKYYTPLVFFALPILKNKEDAENVVQDVFANIWEKREGFAFHSSLKAYLYTSVRNKSLSFLQHKGLESAYIKEEQIKAEVSDADMSYTERKISLMKSAIETLPPKCKEVFLLSRQEGLKYEEISRYLGLSIKTIEAHMGKAFKQIKQFVDENL